MRDAVGPGADRMQIRPPRAVIVQDARRLVGRAVVDHDDRAREKRLREHAVETGGQEPRPVAHRNEHIDVRRSHDDDLTDATAGGRFVARTKIP